MYKKKSVSKLGKPKDQREALIRSQVYDLVKHGYIRTTRARAKQVARTMDIILDHVQKGNKVQVGKFVKDNDLRNKLFGLNLNDRKTGFVTMTALHNRPGDRAEVVLLELQVSRA